ncbi:hypothetical protein KCV03_g10263, partial [Aureobasidium melanogenum]
MAWFEKHRVYVLKYWPPYSPDLNPIEHLWPLLKEALYKLYPDIELWKGGEDQVAERMEDALCHAWSTIRDKIAYNCVASMPERLEAVYIDNACTAPGSMTDPHNCGYDPTWKGRDCGDHVCFGGRCVFDTCNINQTSKYTRISLGIGNGTNVYYLAWYYAENGRNPPDSIALASTVPLSYSIGLFFAESTSNPGFYDLKVESLQLFLGYSPTTGYMVWNNTAGPTTGIWRTDGCDGAMVMTYEDQTYHFAIDDNNFAIARPRSTDSIDKRSSVDYPQFRPFAMRSEETWITATRCTSSKLAQRIPTDDERLKPNGCGSKWTDYLVPKYRFGGCCDEHDKCYSDCATEFKDCNSAFGLCMRQACDRT